MIVAFFPDVLFLKRKLFPHWSRESSPTMYAFQLPVDIFNFISPRPNIDVSSQGKVQLLECEPEHTQNAGWAHLTLQW